MFLSLLAALVAWLLGDRETDADDGDVSGWG